MSTEQYLLRDSEWFVSEDRKKEDQYDDTEQAAECFIVDEFSFVFKSKTPFEFDITKHIELIAQSQETVDECQADINNKDAERKMDQENNFYAADIQQDVISEKQEKPKKTKKKSAKVVSQQTKPQNEPPERKGKMLANEKIKEKKTQLERNVYKKPQNDVSTTASSTTCSSKGKSLTTRKAPAKVQEKVNRASKKTEKKASSKSDVESEDSENNESSESSFSFGNQSGESGVLMKTEVRVNRRNDLFRGASKKIHGYRNTGMSLDDIREIFGDQTMKAILVQICYPMSKKDDQLEHLREAALENFNDFIEMLEAGVPARRRNDEYQKKAYSKWAMKIYLEFKYSPKYPKEKALNDMIRDFNMSVVTEEENDAFNRIFGGDRKKGMNNAAIKVILTNKEIINRLLDQEYLMDVYLDMCRQTENDIEVNLVKRFDADPEALLVELLDKAQSFKMPWSLNQNNLAIHLFLKKLIFRAKKEKLKVVHKKLEGLIEFFNSLH